VNFIVPKTFDLDGLNAAIDLANQSDLPTPIRVSQSIVISHKSGRRYFAGTGDRYLFDPLNLSGDHGPEINQGICIVLDKGASIVFDGCVSDEIGPVTFVAGEGLKSPAIKIINPSNYGSGNHIFRKAQFVGFETAVQFGQPDKNENNNDCTAFYDCRFLNCGNVIQTNGDQQVHYTFVNCDFQYTDTIFDLKRGGNVHGWGCTTFKVNRIFRIGEGGPNVSNNSIVGWRIDNGGLTRHSTALVDGNPAGGAAVSARDCNWINYQVKESVDAGEHLIESPANVKVRLDNCNRNGLQLARRGYKGAAEN
jgi:hypothetical protein